MVNIPKVHKDKKKVLISCSDASIEDKLDEGKDYICMCVPVYLITLLWWDQHAQKYLEITLKEERLIKFFVPQFAAKGMFNIKVIIADFLPAMYHLISCLNC